MNEKKLHRLIGVLDTFARQGSIDTPPSDGFDKKIRECRLEDERSEKMSVM